MSSDPTDNVPPLTFVGGYRLEGLIATGGSSSVWRATGTDGKVVAVKLLDATASATVAERRRFMRGFRAAAGLVHPGIARLLEAGEHDGRLFIVEEFVEGETLAERLREGALPVDDALRVLRACCEILGYAHEAGVVHRDLSPRNLMIDRLGRVVLVDFGIAVRPEGTTQPVSHTLIGTFGYLAPELIRGLPPTPRSDLYSLGSIAYQMLAGVPPFVASQPEALLQHHLQSKPKSLRALRPGLAAKLDRLVLKLLAKSPSDRFATARDLEAALDTAAASPPRESVAADAAPARVRRRRTSPAVRRVAVTPFTADMEDGSDPERPSRMSRGLSETVAAGLASIEGVMVVPPAQVIGSAFTSMSDLAERLGVDAIVGAHLAEAEVVRRLSWTLTGRDGHVIAGGRVWGAKNAPFELEDALLGELIRALRRPVGSAPIRGAAGRDAWYGPFLEALGCIQRGDDRQQIDRGITLLEQIRDAGAGGVQVHAALGRAYLRRAELTHELKWRERAESSCRVAISLDPLAPEAMLTMGRLLLSGGRAEEATGLLARALELEPASADARLWLSRAHEMRGQLDEADHFAQTACVEWPNLWTAHDRKAVLDFRRGRYEAAAQAWERVIELTPDNAHAWAKLAAARFELGELEGAEAGFRRALEVRRFAEALSGLGSVLFFKGQIHEAIHCCREAAELAPEYWHAWGNLADAQRWAEGERANSIDSFDRAIALVRAALAVNGSNASAWASLATYLAKREQHAEAHEALKRAMDHGAHSVQVLACAVVVHELAGRRSDAVAALTSLTSQGQVPFALSRDPELHDLRAGGTLPGSSGIPPDCSRMVS